MSTDGGGNSGNMLDVGGIRAEFEFDTGNFGPEMEKIRQQLQGVWKQIFDLEHAFISGKVAPEQYAASLKALVDRERELVSASHAVADAVTATATATQQVSVGMAGVHAATDKASQGGQNFGRTLLAVGYAADDLQYGMFGCRAA